MDTCAISLVQQGPPGSAQLSGGQFFVIYVALLIHGRQVVPAQISEADAAVSNSDYPFWPTETDLIYAPSSNRLKLTGQSPIVRSVVVNAIENLRAAMLLSGAFPDVCSVLTLIKDCFLTSASYLLPGAADVLDRLKSDPDYLSKLTVLVRPLDD